MLSAWLVFALLLGAAALLVWTANRDSKSEPNYRVVHFTLWLALTFGTGAVIVATLLALASLGVIPNFRTVLNGVWFSY